MQYTLGSTDDEAVITSTLDSSNNIYFGGNFSGTTVDFGGGARNANNGDSFIAKYDSDGTYIYDVVIGGTGLDQINDE